MQRRSFLSVSGLAVASTAVGAGVAYAEDRGARSLPRGAVRATLDKASYKPGSVMKLTIREDISPRRIKVTDGAGLRWKRVHNDRDRAVYHAIAPRLQTRSHVKVRVVRRSDRADFTARLDYQVSDGQAGGGARWAGHQPGQVKLGLSTSDLTASLAAVGSIGLRRTFYQWNSASGEDRAIDQDHSAGRLPWISYKPPGGSVSGWKAIADGKHDAEIRARAKRYAGYDAPVIVTFHHEPTNESGDPADWAAAWVRQYDLMNDETGLKNVAFAPIIGDWEFNPKNKDRRPQQFVTRAVLERLPFLGIDCYQNGRGEGFSVRLERILDFMEYYGVEDPMVGVGETGCCLAESDRPEQWLQDNWDWATANTDKIGAMSYFDSSRNSKDGHVWNLKETPGKLATYRGLLAHSRSA